MNPLIDFLKKTVGQKIIVAVTGLGLCLFVLIHMLGNLFIFSGSEAYNSYAHQLHEFPLLIIFELGLLLFFAGHIFLAVLLQIKNRTAKGSIPYNLPAKGEKGRSLVHRFIWFQAGVLLLFVIFHLKSFKFGPHYEIFLEGEAVRDIYQLVVESFKNPFYTVGYSLALFVLSIHLLRGIPASLKSLGLSHSVYISLTEKLTWLFTLVVIFGFLAPIWYIFIFL